VRGDDWPAPRHSRASGNPENFGAALLRSIVAAADAIAARPLGPRLREDDGRTRLRGDDALASIGIHPRVRTPEGRGMMRTLALAGRELRSYFLSPAGYIIIGLFLLITGFVFILTPAPTGGSFAFDNGQPASIRWIFSIGMWLLIFICPAISMRAIAEERRLGTFEMLMTCPVGETQVISGKFLAMVAFLCLMLLPTLVYVIALEWHGRPDYGELACGYLGMLLLGCTYLASGILASTLTSSQVVAFLLTLFLWIALTLGAKLLPPYLPEPFATAAFAADPDPRLRDFAIGLIDTSNIVYFVSLTALFLMASVASLAARRWP
jgi:ABC-2 type transport system permease protein